MSNIPTNEVPRIQTRANVGSRALDNGLQNLRNRHNELVTTVSNINTSGSGSEVSTARPNHSDLLNRLNDITKPFPNAVNGLKVVEDSSSASMSVEIESGNGSVAGVQVSKTSTTTGLTLTAPTTNPYYAIIYINSSNTIAVTYGVEESEPVYPNIADTQKALGLVYLDTSTTLISNSDIIDVRGWGLYKAGQDGSFEYQFNLKNITSLNNSEKYTIIGDYKKATELQITPKSNTSFDLTGFSLKTFASSPSHGVEVVLGSNVESVHFFGGNITPDGSADHGLNITGDSTNTNINFNGIKIDNTSANEDVSIGAIGQITITGDFETVDNSATDYLVKYNNNLDLSNLNINTNPIINGDPTINGDLSFSNNKAVLVNANNEYTSSGTITYDNVYDNTAFLGTDNVWKTVNGNGSRTLGTASRFDIFFKARRNGTRTEIQLMAYTGTSASGSGTRVFNNGDGASIYTGGIYIRI